MLAVEMDEEEDPRTPGRGAFTEHVQRELIRRGFLTARRPGLNVLRLDPPLMIPRAEVQAFLEAFEEVLAQLRDAR